METEKTILSVEGLRIEFSLRHGTSRAVDGLSLHVESGRTLGIIGESGCGKSLTGRAILNMIPPPGRVPAGRIRYRRKDGGEIANILQLDPEAWEMRRLRGGEIAMIFQEPMSSLTPVYTVGSQIMESIRIHRGLDRKASRQLAVETLNLVGIPQPEKRVDSYPHQLSGGQRQRAMIAIALSGEPALLIADEPTTALDVSVEAQILQLLRELQQRRQMAIMFITHNLGVVAEMADRILVMYLGREMEVADKTEIIRHPGHPYTQALLQAVPVIGRKKQQRLASIPGIVPAAEDRPPGCVFHPRCPSCQAGRCDQQEPALKEINPGHHVRCWLYDK